MEPQPILGCVPWDLPAFLGQDTDRCGATVDGAAKDAPGLCFCVTWIHPHSYVWPHEIRFLLLGFTTTPRNCWACSGALACSLGTCKVLWGQIAIKTWGVGSFILGSLMGTCTHGLSYTPSSNTLSCTMCERALPWHVAPEPCLGPSAGHLEGGPAAAAGLTCSPAARITRLSSSKECPLPPGHPFQGSTWSTHWLELLSSASPFSKSYGPSQISPCVRACLPSLGSVQ